MSNRYIAQVDPGYKYTREFPRWAVWEQYFIWAGNHGTRRVSDFYMTEAEAHAELERLERVDQSKNVIAGLVVLAILVFVLAYIVFLR